MPQQLQDEPECPHMAQYLWNWFCELHGARSGNAEGVNPVSFRDILDWQEVTGHKLHQWEVRAVRALDQAYLKEEGKK